MDNHPIPQDITGFEFKLIGDMTLKQFAYLAAGLILAWISFSLPVSPLIKLPFTLIFITFGVSFAFFSIEGRSVDTMITNFIKAGFSPTKFIYQPQAQETKNIQTQVQKNAFRPGFYAPAKQSEEHKLDKKEFDFFHMLSQMLTPAASHAPSPAGETSKPFIISAKGAIENKSKLSSSASLQKDRSQSELASAPKIEVLVSQTQTLQKELEEAKKEEEKDEGQPSFEAAHQKVLDLEKVLSQTALEKQKLEEEIINLKKQLQTQKPVYAPSVAQAPQTTKNVRIIPKELEKSAGIPIAPEFPNVISGIIKDPRGNPIPNILVEVKDSEGNPVRAFKTNALGQFWASTPLADGSYTIEFEDPNSSNSFDSVAFKAEGNVILPIEVISIDKREELRKSLFN